LTPRMERRSARLLLAVVVALTSALALRYYDGHDFINNVWAPTHGLLAGLNPYDPGDVEYLLRYRVPVVAGLYVPAALALHAPLAPLSPARCADVVAVLDTGLIWLGVLLLIPPRSARSCLAAAVAGSLVLLSAPAQDTVSLGQLSGWAFGGLALLVASLSRDASAVWLPAVGTALVALKPQSGVPMFVALGILGYGRVLARAAVMLLVASLPGAALFYRAAGSFSGLMRTIGDNLVFLPSLPPGDLTNPTNLRIDGLGLITQVHGPALPGLGWIAVTFVVATALFVIAARVSQERAPDALTDPFVVTLLTVYITTSFYHLMYDQLLLYVGPLAALARLPGDAPQRLRLRIVALGGVVLLAAGIVFRSGLRDQLIALGLPALAVHRLWVVIPTVVGIAIVAWGLLRDRRGTAPAG
jgi:glycosyl transferase family 87